jgi:hypothetical protein
MLPVLPPVPSSAVDPPVLLPEVPLPATAPPRLEPPLLLVTVPGLPVTGAPEPGTMAGLRSIEPVTSSF